MHIATGTLALIRLHKKADLLEIKVNSTKDRKVMQTKISFDLGKNEDHMPSSLDGRLIFVERQAGR